MFVCSFYSYRQRFHRFFLHVPAMVSSFPFAHNDNGSRVPPHSVLHISTMGPSLHGFLIRNSTHNISGEYRKSSTTFFKDFCRKKEVRYFKYFIAYTDPDCIYKQARKQADCIYPNQLSTTKRLQETSITTNRCVML